MAEKRPFELDMPKLTIDGKKIEVPKGTRVIEAAKRADIDVPFYCYHPGLSIAGNCRMCLVEIEKMPKLQIACHIEAQDGMAVKTNTEKVMKTRRHVLEFLLVNHPLDCPVCDQAGECWLQDYYMRYGAYDSRLHENKIKKEKAVPVGPHVMLDAERCILCSRCVRFCDEVSKTSELGIINRGDHSEITVFPEKELNNPYSGNTVDICPVGALTDRDFRFKIRVWYLKSKDTLCNGCARGCNIQMQYRTDRLHHAKGERVMRLKPRFNENVNRWWMCDEGRYGYKFHDHNRITQPLQRTGNQVLEISWETALADAARKIAGASKKIGVFVSPQLSNEELFLAKRLFKEHFKLSDLFLVSPNPEGYQDDILIRADKNPNSKGAEFLGFQYDDQALKDFFERCGRGQVEGIIVFGQDLLTLHGPHPPNIAADSARLHMAQPALDKLAWSIFIGSNHNLMSEYASYVLPSATYAEKEGTFANFEGRIQKFEKVFEPLGEALPEWGILTQLAGRLNLHFHYDCAEDIFYELSLAAEPFRDLNYEKLATGGSDIRQLAAPMIPDLEQNAPLIFAETKSEGYPAAPQKISRPPS